MLPLATAKAWAESPDTPRKNAFTIYAGPGVPTVLVDLVRFKNIELVSDTVTVAALSREIWTDQEALALEVEGQFAKFLEKANLFSVNGALIIRWLRTPWSKGLGATFGFGNGLSYANGIPKLEAERLERTNKLLYHLLFEASFPVTTSKRWEAVFRLQHRSGVFGLFNDVVGGSDYLCLGIKYRF